MQTIRASVSSLSFDGSVGVSPLLDQRRHTHGMSSTQPGWSAEVEAVYAAQARELWALFYAHCSDPERADDALQESFLRLYAHSGEPIRDKRAWLLRVGRNWLRDVARRKSSSVRRSDRLDEVASGQGDPTNRLLDEETQGEVRDALMELKSEDREVLVLRYAMNWPSQRIAQSLETTAAAVDMRLSRARRRLASLLEESRSTND